MIRHARKLSQRYQPGFCRTERRGRYIGQCDQPGGVGTDQFRLRSNLTVNVGLLWISGIPADDKAAGAELDLEPSGIIDFNVPKLKTAFSADIWGIATLPEQRQYSIRAGFGLTYDKIFENQGTLAVHPKFQHSGRGARQIKLPEKRGIPAMHRRLLRAALPLLPRDNIAYIPDQMLPYAMTWNFGVSTVRQRHTLDVRYLGTRVFIVRTQRLNRVSNSHTERLPADVSDRAIQPHWRHFRLLWRISMREQFFSRVSGFNSNLFALKTLGTLRKTDWQCN